ncbi:MAG: DUF58 domain-containing protein [Spirochaetaceae bacterium]|nr:DUF58 domain-containing protein [Spirochaetaceae bacterium]
MESKTPPRKSAPLLPRPQKQNAVLFVLAVFALAIGTLKGESVLLLIGGILISSAAYGFVAVFVLSLFYRRQIPRAETIPAVQAGSYPAVRIDGVPFHLIRLPACLVRYRLNLVSQAFAQAGGELPPTLFFGAVCGCPAPPRGAYYGPEDSLVIYDALGFWRSSLPIRQANGVRLCVTPRPLTEPFRLRSPAAGGSKSRAKSLPVPSEDHSEHRAYVPGDDPRRINWKLYGHINELFVHIPEHEIPPRSVLTILLDTACDSGLFPPAAAAAAVDTLCSAALSLALEAQEAGMDAKVVWLRNEATDIPPPPLSLPLEQQLAYPIPLPLDCPVSLPVINTTAFLYIALPRARRAGQNSPLGSVPAGNALDACFSRRAARTHIQLLFIYPQTAYNAERIRYASEANVLYYGRMERVYAEYAVL